MATSEDIIIEFEGNFDLDSVKDKQLQLIGVETDEPVLRIESKFYKLDIKDSLGTRLLFETDETDGKTKYLTKSDKLIIAKRVMIKPK